MPYQKTIKYYNCAELTEFLESLCNAIDGIHGGISSRSEAIAEALKIAKKGDTILLAGKGHETYQVIGTERVHYDEREVIKSALNR